MNKRNGFTVIELLVVIAFLIAVAVLGFFQLSKIRNESDNTKKRTAINAMYYSLEEGFYAKNGYYLTHAQLPFYLHLMKHLAQ